MRISCGLTDVCNTIVPWYTQLVFCKSIATLSCHFDSASHQTGLVRWNLQLDQCATCVLPMTTSTKIVETMIHLPLQFWTSQFVEKENPSKERKEIPSKHSIRRSFKNHVRPCIVLRHGFTFEEDELIHPSSRLVEQSTRERNQPTCHHHLW